MKFIALCSLLAAVSNSLPMPWFPCVSCFKAEEELSASELEKIQRINSAIFNVEDGKLEISPGVVAATKHERAKGLLGRLFRQEKSPKKTLVIPPVAADV